MKPPRDMRTLLIAGLVCSNIMVFILSGVSLYHSRQQYEQHAETQTRNIANAVDHNVSSSIEKIDLALRTVADELERQLASTGMDEQAMTDFLERQEQRLPEVEGFRVANAYGLVILGKGLDRKEAASWADRDYFIYHRDHDDRSLQITKPLMGRVAKKYLIGFAQRYNYPGGSFAGVTTAAVVVEHFNQLLSRFDLGSHGAIALRDADFSLIARFPAIPGSPVGQSAASIELRQLIDSGVRSATYHALVASDGVERAITFHRLEKAQMTVLVGVAKKDYLANWTTEVYQTSAMAIGFLLLSLLLGGFLRRLLVEAEKREQLLSESKEELHCLNRELEQRVEERTAQLESANKELEAFAYSVSHDLRAPLRHIDGFIELLQERTTSILDEQSRHYVAVTSDSAKRLGMLIDDLLSFSRMGRAELSKEQVDLGALVQEVIREFEPETHDRAIHWRIADLPVVTGDRAMLRIVLVNLISNALKYTRPRPQAEIEIGCTPGQETETIVFIRDNGVGFDMNYADKLFGVFQRLHRAEESEGTGIGLANVLRIMNRHGGRVWAEGQVDQGATFYFSLPQLTPGG